MSERESLVAELWYATAPDLSDRLLLEGLRAVSPGTEAQDGSLVVPYDGGELPARVDPPPTATDPHRRRWSPVVVPGSPLGEGGKTLPDTSQTWDWAGAEEALAGARASVLVTEMFAEPYGPRDRIAALVGGRRGAHRRDAARSRSAGRRASASPTRRRRRRTGSAGWSTSGSSRCPTTRTSWSWTPAASRPSALPDLQVHFRDLEPGRLAGLLYATAGYLLEEGDVIADGNTISGLEGDEHWRCEHEDRSGRPARTVIDIDPGDPYAAGRRAR